MNINGTSRIVSSAWRVFILVTLLVGCFWVAGAQPVSATESYRINVNLTTFSITGYGWSPVDSWVHLWFCGSDPSTFVPLNLTTLGACGYYEGQKVTSVSGTEVVVFTGGALRALLDLPGSWILVGNLDGSSPQVPINYKIIPTATFTVSIDSTADTVSGVVNDPFAAYASAILDCSSGLLDAARNAALGGGTYNVSFQAAPGSGEYGKCDITNIASGSITLLLSGHDDRITKSWYTDFPKVQVLHDLTSGVNAVGEIDLLTGSLNDLYIYDADFTLGGANEIYHASQTATASPDSPGRGMVEYILPSSVHLRTGLWVYIVGRMSDGITSTVNIPLDLTLDTLNGTAHIAGGAVDNGVTVQARCQDISSDTADSVRQVTSSSLRWAADFTTPGAGTYDYDNGFTCELAAGSHFDIRRLYTGGHQYILKVNYMDPGIYGWVADSHSNPVAGVNIWDDAGHSTVTGADGTYALSITTPGTYVLSASKEQNSVSPSSVAIPLGANQIYTQDFTATAPPFFLLSPIGGAGQTKRTVTLSWQSFAGAYRYTAFLSYDGVSFMVKCRNIRPTSCRVSVPNYKKVTWYVQAFNASRVLLATSGRAVFNSPYPPGRTLPVIPTRRSIQSLTPTFTWTRSNPSWAVDHYVLTITGWGATTVSGSSNTFTLPGALPTAGTFRWKVRACNDVGLCSKWSSQNEFYTMPAQPMLSMADGSTGVSLRPLLTWAGDGLTTRFRLKVSTSASLASPLQFNVRRSFYQFTRNLLPGTPYFWQVCPRHRRGFYGPCSAINSFTTAP